MSSLFDFRCLYLCFNYAFFSLFVWMQFPITICFVDSMVYFPNYFSCSCFVHEMSFFFGFKLIAVCCYLSTLLKKLSGLEFLCLVLYFSGIKVSVL